MDIILWRILCPILRMHTSTITVIRSIYVLNLTNGLHKSGIHVQHHISQLFSLHCSSSTRKLTLTLTSGKQRGHFQPTKSSRSWGMLVFLESPNQLVRQQQSPAPMRSWHSKPTKEGTFIFIMKFFGDAPTTVSKVLPCHSAFMESDMKIIAYITERYIFVRLGVCFLKCLFRYICWDVCY